MNLGYMQVESATDAGTITARIYYDSTVPAAQPQPLIDGPRGYCLDVTNTGPTRTLSYALPDGTSGTSAPVGTGNPVGNRSLRAAQLASAGFRYRPDAAGFSIT